MTRDTAQYVDILTMDECLKLYEELGAKKDKKRWSISTRFKSQRNAMAFAVLWRCSLRASEMCGIRLQHVDLEDRTITIYGKGKKRRVVGIDRWLYIPLKLWMEWLVDMGDTGENWLFPSRQSHANKLGYDNYRATVKNAAKRVGITKRITLHLLRHTSAVEMVREKIPVEQLRRHLGHTSLSVTQHYLHGLYSEETLDLVRERVVPGQKTADSHTAPDVKAVEPPSQVYQPFQVDTTSYDYFIE